METVRWHPRVTISIAGWIVESAQLLNDCLMYRDTKVKCWLPCPVVLTERRDAAGLEPIHHDGAGGLCSRVLFDRWLHTLLTFWSG